jgi:hypothetical protein
MIRIWATSLLSAQAAPGEPLANTGELSAAGPEHRTSEDSSVIDNDSPEVRDSSTFRHIARNDTLI